MKCASLTFYQRCFYTAALLFSTVVGAVTLAQVLSKRVSHLRYRITTFAQLVCVCVSLCVGGGWWVKERGKEEGIGWGWRKEG